MHQPHQPATVMFSGILSYIALMGRDEQKAIEILTKNCTVQKPATGQYNGWWIKEPGAGVLASLSNISDAVYAAIKIMESYNVAKDVQLSIGNQPGELIFEHDDVFGAGISEKMINKHTEADG